jgi:Leucine-rich repeat (LRR) protein
VVSVEVRCKYYGYDWNNWGKRYTCGASLEDVKDSVKVSSVVGDHLLKKSNNDVKAVDISGQKTNHLVQELFSFFPNMEELYVFRSDLKYVSRLDFKGYTKLITMSLSRNQLSTLPNDSFVDLTNMEYFSLSVNQLTTVPNLKAMSKLKELYLFQNNIETFMKDDIVGNPNLKLISLHGNKLRTIDALIFGHLPSLREADFTANNCIDRKYSRKYTGNGTDAALVSFVRKIKKVCGQFLR